VRGSRPLQRMRRWSSRPRPIRTGIADARRLKLKIGVAYLRQLRRPKILCLKNPLDRPAVIAVRSAPAREEVDCGTFWRVWEGRGFVLQKLMYEGEWKIVEHFEDWRAWAGVGPVGFVPHGRVGWKIVEHSGARWVRFAPARRRGGRNDERQGAEDAKGRTARGDWFCVRILSLLQVRRWCAAGTRFAHQML